MEKIPQHLSLYNRPSQSHRKEQFIGNRILGGGMGVSGRAHSFSTQLSMMQQMGIHNPVAGTLV